MPTPRRFAQDKPREPRPASRLEITFVAALAAAVCAVATSVFFRQAELLSLPVLKILVTQIQMAVGGGDLGLGGEGQGPIPRALQFIWIAPMTGVEILGYYPLRSLFGPAVALTVLRGGQLAFYELGAPLLLLAASKSRLSRTARLGLTLLYVLQPLILAKLSWDLVAPAPPLLIAAYLGWTARRPAIFVPFALLAVTCHPLSFAGLACWFVWKARRCNDPEMAKYARWTVRALVLAGFIMLLGVHLPAFLWGDGTVGGSLIRISLEHRSTVADSFLNLAEIALLLLTVGGLVAVRPGCLLVLAVDLIYYTVSAAGIDHGLLPSTAGLLFILSIDILRDLAWEPSRLWWTIAIASSLVINMMWDTRSFVLQLDAAAPPPPSYETVVASISSLPADALSNARCIVQPSLMLGFDGRCTEVAPFAGGPWGNAELGPGRTIVAFAPARLRDAGAAWTTGYSELAAVERPRVVLDRLAEGIRTGRLGLAEATADLVLLDSASRVEVPASVVAALRNLAQPIGDRRPLPGGAGLE